MKSKNKLSSWFFGFLVLSCVLIINTNGVLAYSDDGWGGDYLDTYTNSWDSTDSYSNAWDSYDSYSNNWSSYDNSSNAWNSSDSFTNSWNANDSFANTWNSTDSYNNAWNSADSFTNSWNSTDSYANTWNTTDNYSNAWNSTDSFTNNFNSTDSYTNAWNSTDSYNNAWSAKDSYNNAWNAQNGYTNSFSTPAVYSPAVAQQQIQSQLQRQIAQQPSYPQQSYRPAPTPSYPTPQPPRYTPTPTPVYPTPYPTPVPTPIPAPTPTPVCTITIYTANSIITKGQGANIVWYSSNASYVTLSGGVYNNTRVNGSGNNTVYPQVNTTYTAICYSYNGQRNIASVNIVVNNPIVVPPIIPQPPIYTPPTYNPPVYVTPAPTPCYNCSTPAYVPPVYVPPAQTPCYTCNYPVLPPQQTDYCVDYRSTGSVATTGAVPLKTTATIYGYVNPYSNTNSTIWFNYGTSYNNLKWKTTQESTSYVGSFTASLSGLNCGTTYYYQAVTQNYCGIKYGQILSFTTSACKKTYTPAPAPKPTKPVITKGLVGVDLGTEKKTAACACDNSYITLSIQNLETASIPGKLSNFRITYQNNGTENLRNVVIRVVLPEQMQVYSADNGQYSQGGKTLLVNIPSLYTGENGSIILTAATDPNITLGTQMLVNAYANYTVPTVVKDNQALSGEATAYTITTVSGTNQTIGSGNSNNSNVNTTGSKTSTTTSWYPTSAIEWIVAIIAILAFLLVLRFVINAFRAPTTTV